MSRPSTPRYLTSYEDPRRKLEDGSFSRAPESLIYLPLVTQGRVLGVITIQSFRKGAYTEYHLNLLQNLAAYTSIALDNANAYRQLNEQERQIRQRAAELATIDNISRALASELEFAALIPLVGEQVRQIFNAQIAYLALFDKATNTIHFPYGYGEEFPSLPLGVGMTSRIIQTGEPLLINEDIGNRTAQLNIKRSGVAAKAYLGVPIPVGSDVIGVLSVQSTEEEGRFTDDDLRLLTTIAANVGVAIHNARLFEETRQARAAAEEADAAKSAFLSTVSHELRTPLTSVLGFAKIIRKRLEERIFPLLAGDDAQGPTDGRADRREPERGHQRGRAAHQADRRRAGPGQDRGGQARVAHGHAGSGRRHRSRRGGHLVAVRAQGSSARQGHRARPASGGRRRRPAAAGRDQPHLQRGEVHRRRVCHLPGPTPRRGDRRQRDRHRPRHHGGGSAEGVREVQAGRRHAHRQAERHRPRPADLPGDRRASRRPNLGGERAGQGQHLLVRRAGQAPGRPSRRARSVSRSLVRQLREQVVGTTPRTDGRQPSVLAVDDDPHIRALLAQEFTDAGYRLRLATNGREALDRSPRASGPTWSSST